MKFLAENSKRSKDDKHKWLLFKMKLFIKYWFTEFKKLDTNEIDLILSYQKKFYELKTKELNDTIKGFNNVLNKSSYEDLVSEYIKFSKIQFERKLNSKFKNDNDFKFTKRSYLKEFSRFKNRFPVILSSTYAIVNSVPKGFLFDYLIIDESSQVDLITWLLVFSCCKNVIIVWDTKQLPHITNGKNPDDFNLDPCFDYYKHSVLSSVLDSYKDNIPVTLLKEHYRCHPKIINFCNQKYYNWELIIYTKENENDNPLTIYRSAEWNHMRDIQNWESNWKYNQRELDIIKGILEGEEVGLKDLENIGIITPFRKQVEKADITFKKVVEVDTVHKFQWREKDTIIISTVLDNTRSWNIAIRFADQPSLINVAVSRAKNKLLIVTDNELFFKKWKEIKDLVKYVEYSSLDKNIIESEIVWVFDLLYENYSDKITLSNESIIQVSKFKSEDIWNALIKKILDDEKFSNLSFRREVYLKNIISDTNKLNDIEKKFVNTTSRVDFLVYSNFWKTPLLVIEVDGVAFHENKPEQIERDRKKNSILDKYSIPYLRLKTNWSWEDKRVYDKLLSIVNYEYCQAPNI
jgi:superfamily I DNA and/or RNA helicase